MIRSVLRSACPFNCKQPHLCSDQRQESISMHEQMSNASLPPSGLTVIGSLLVTLAQLCSHCIRRSLLSYGLLKIHIDETALRMCLIQPTIFFWPVAALYRFGCVGIKRICNEGVKIVVCSDCMNDLLPECASQSMSKY